jgi:hypothetical protein
MRYKNTAKMYIRFEDEMGNFVGFSEVKEINVPSDDWLKLELDVNIVEETTKMLIIFEFQGYGAMFIDDVECFTYNNKNVSDRKKMVLKNPGFELPLEFDVNNWLTTNETFDLGYRISYSDMIKHSGRQSVVIYTPDYPPFFISPDSSMINFDVLVLENGTINCSVPIYVEATTSETIIDSIRTLIYQTEPHIEPPKLETGKNKNFSMNWNDRDSRLANAMFLYNCVNHFYDIFSEVDLEEFAICDSKERYIELLHKIIGKEKRNRVWDATSGEIRYSLPFQAEIYNDSLYIKDVLEAAKGDVNEGYRITKIEGKDWKEFLIDTNVSSREINSLLKENFLSGKLQELRRFSMMTDRENSTGYFYNALPANFPFKAIYGWGIINDSIVYIT